MSGVSVALLPARLHAQGRTQPKYASYSSEGGISFDPPQAAAKTKSGSPISVTVYYRGRADAWNWFAAPPINNTYGYYESLLRVGIAQRIRSWDWALELSQAAVLGLPDDAVSPVSAQGQLGLGGTYYAANGNNTEPAAAFLKQAFARYRFHKEGRDLRIGRFEFFDGLETKPKDPTMAWLQNNRIANRLLSNFGFANAQRSFDGADGHYGWGAWDLTGFAARSDQGVFNMNGNPELNVDAQYLALSRLQPGGHLLWRAFAVGYHDGRTGLTKTDNRPLSVRSAVHQNIRIATYGGDIAAIVPAGRGQFDFMAWAVGQNGSWGTQGDSANAIALEGGFKLRNAEDLPWLRGGWFRSSGDDNPTDGTHHTFFQVLPTPRLYARTPFYNLMNNTDGFVQVLENPTSRLTLRSDLHWLQLTSGKDLWYQGGGAFDNKVFGYIGRPGNNATSFATVADLSADWSVTKSLGLNFYYGHTWGKTVVRRIYPTNADQNFGFAELVYRWGIAQRAQ